MKYKIKTGFKDSAGGTVDKNPPANAGHTNWKPPATGQLSSCATTAEPVCCRTCELQLRKPRCPRAPAPNRTSVCPATGEEPAHRSWRRPVQGSDDQHSHK